MKRRLLLCAALCAPLLASGQSAAVKTNLLSGALLSFNAGAEFAVSDRWSLDFFGSYNPWTLSGNKKWKHATLQPELRHWPCRTFYGWFIGAHTQVGVYNVGQVPLASARNRRYEGWFAGGGLGLGYHWILTRRLSFEWEVGGGYNYSRYDEYRCPRCGEKTASNQPYHYFGMTKAHASLVYVF